MLPNIEGILNDNIRVSILCTSYNQFDYIELALQSFLSQKTNFKFEILIHDDASTDGTVEILKKYETQFPENIHCIYQTENQHSRGKSVSKNLFDIAKGKYIAVCEGDDFWTSEHKLQIQYDFMESHLDYSLCAHSGFNIYEDGQQKNHLFRPFNANKTVTTEDIISKWLFPTASLFYRKCLRIPYEIPFAKGAPCGDYPLAIFLSLKGNVQYFDQPLCCYRNMSKSSLSKISSDNTEYRINFNTRIIRMLEELDDYTNKQFHNVIQVRIFEYQKANFALEEKNIVSLIKEGYFKGFTIKESIKRFLNYLFPNFYRKLAILKGKYYRQYYEQKNIVYEALSFEDFCKKIDRMNNAL